MPTALVPKKVMIQPKKGGTPYSSTRWVSPKHAFDILSSKRILELSEQELSVHSKETIKALSEIASILAQYETIEIFLEKEGNQEKLSKVTDLINSTREYFQRLYKSYQQILERETKHKEIYQNEIKIYGENNEQRSEINEVIKLIPTKHLQTISSIKISSDISVFLVFHSDIKQLEINKYIDFPITIYHGIGRLVYQNILSSHERNITNKIFNEFAFRQNISQISLIGIIHTEFLFAEGYRLYLQNEKKLEQFSKYIYQFLKKIFMESE